MKKQVLIAKKLYCERDDRLLFQNLDLEFHEGEVVQIRGPNGCGKTTLLRKLSGLADVVTGELNWQDPFGETDWIDPSKFLYLGHKPGITGSATALENLIFHYSLKGLNAPTEEALFAALHQVGLTGFEHVYAHSLSAGQQRRVALARLYLMGHQMPVWILDEPFTALDVKGVMQLESHIENHAKNGGLVVLTTHHPLDIASARMVDVEAFV